LGGASRGVGGRFTVAAVSGLFSALAARSLRIPLSTVVRGTVTEFRRFILFRNAQRLHTSLISTA
jgi:hypothetical protein